MCTGLLRGLHIAGNRITLASSSRENRCLSCHSCCAKPTFDPWLRANSEIKNKKFAGLRPLPAPGSALLHMHVHSQKFMHVVKVSQLMNHFTAISEDPFTGVLQPSLLKSAINEKRETSTAKQKKKKKEWIRTDRIVQRGKIEKWGGGGGKGEVCRCVGSFSRAFTNGVWVIDFQAWSRNIVQGFTLLCRVCQALSSNAPSLSHFSLTE